MITVDNFNYAGARVLTRVDFNVPLSNDFRIEDDTRITATLPTLKKILDDGGRLVLMSHLGRPKDGPEEAFSLKHLVSHLSELLRCKVHFVDDCVGAKAGGASENLKDGEVLLLENLRFHPEETAGDIEFAKQLAANGDYYVNDAFGAAHREHASTCIIARFFPAKRAFGYLMASEVANLDRLLQSDEHPFTAIIGGAKVSDKILVLDEMVQKADYLLIGGAMAYTFIRAWDGKTGSSKVEEDRINLAKDFLAVAESSDCRLMLPRDSVAANDFRADADTRITDSFHIPSGWMGLDIGPEARKEYAAIIAKSRLILWNGPMGVFEMEQFRAGTLTIAEAIADATDDGAYSLIGGGDSVSAINRFGLQDRVSYISTGGGAMLEYIQGEDLPGVKAILGSHHS
ncbi:MAG: phosphoglycerate kinase [Bacteroidia bacterium]